MLSIKSLGLMITIVPTYTSVMNSTVSLLFYLFITKSYITWVTPVISNQVLCNPSLAEHPDHTSDVSTEKKIGILYLMVSNSRIICIKSCLIVRLHQQQLMQFSLLQSAGRIPCQTRCHRRYRDLKSWWHRVLFLMTVWRNIWLHCGSVRMLQFQ